MEKPEIDLGDLKGPEGNAFVILGKARKIAIDNGLDWDNIKDEATSGDYDHLLEVIGRHFEVV